MQSYTRDSGETGLELGLCLGLTLTKPLVNL